MDDMMIVCERNEEKQKDVLLQLGSRTDGLREHNVRFSGHPRRDMYGALPVISTNPTPRTLSRLPTPTFPDNLCCVST
jgi:hypothetical protein